MIVVVGGGPAGLAAAATLARAGCAVVVHEAGAYPRHRVCGEFLSPDAEGPLADLGLAGLTGRLGAPSIGGARATASRRGRVVADTSWALEAPGTGVSRLDLDEALADGARASGAEIRVRSRLREFGGAEAVVVATGRQAAPGDGSPPEERAAWIGVKVHVRGVRLPGTSELHAVAGAYVGLNEVVRRGEIVVNVCALLRIDAWRRAGASPAGAWEHLARESPAFAERWRRATPDETSVVASSGFSFRARAPVRGGALVIGDAAGLVAPFSGAGQATALASGIAAARCLLASEDPAAAWRVTCARRFAPRLRVGRLVQGALLSSSTAPWLVRGVAASPRAARWLYRATRGPFVTPIAGAAAPR